MLDIYLVIVYNSSHAHRDRTKSELTGVYIAAGVVSGREEGAQTDAGESDALGPAGPGGISGVAEWRESSRGREPRRF